MEGEQDFHFSEWCFLARIDPDAFERRRVRLIEDFLSRSGRHRSRLENLQAAIDREREEAGSAREVLLMLSRKMCGSLWLLEEELKELSDDLHRLNRIPKFGRNVLSTWCRSSRLRPYARRSKRLRSRI